MKKNLFVICLFILLVFFNIPSFANTQKPQNPDAKLPSIENELKDNTKPQVSTKPHKYDKKNASDTSSGKNSKFEKHLQGIVTSIDLNVKCPSIKFPHKFTEYEDFGAEVADLATKVPNVTNYEQSFLWRKETNVLVNKDKSLDITRKVIAYIGENVPECYRLYCVPLAKGATLELLDARVYDPKSGAPVSLLTASPVNLEGGGFALMLSVTQEAVGRVVVMAYKEHRPAEEHISFYTSFADVNLPIWDQNLTVKTPKDIELYFDGLNSDNLSKVDEADSITYLWHTTNQLAEPENPFIEQHRPYIAFSNKLGGLTAIRSLSEILSNAYQNVKIPDKFRNMDFREVLKIIDDTNNTLPSVSQTLMRDSAVVPANGPWTLWEKVAIVSSYAKQLGASINYSYIPNNEVTDKSSATRELLGLPLLQIAEKSGRTSYFVPNGSGCFDKISPLVAGRTTYFERKDKIKKKKLKALSAKANHLDFYWKLKLDENGTSVGTLDVDYAGTWQTLLACDITPTKENIDEFMKQAFTLSMPGLQLTCTGVSQIGNDRIHLDFDVKCQQAIVQGDRMLFRIPGGLPNSLLSLNPKQKKYTFKFPFSIDQKADVSIPAGYRLMQNPLLANTPADSTMFIVKQVFDYKPQWRRLELDSKLVVKLRDVTAEQMQYIGQQLAAVCRWSMTDVGFAKKSVMQDLKKQSNIKTQSKTTQKAQDTETNNKDTENTQELQQKN